MYRLRAAQDDACLPPTVVYVWTLHFYEVHVEDQERHPFMYIPCYTENLSRCWESVLHLGTKVEFPKGESFWLGNDKEEFGYIQKGLVSSYFKEIEGTKDEIRSFIGEGCLIKETLCSCGYGRFKSHHLALSDVTIYLFDYSLIYQTGFFDSHTDLMRNFLFSLAAKSLSAQFFSSILKQATTSQKIAFYLYGFYLFRGKRLSFVPPLSQNQLALLLGIDPMTVNRVIGGWKKENILTCWTKSHIELVDIERIRALRFEAP